LQDRVDKKIKKREWQQAYEEITAFERQLADDGNVIVKFFLHISQKEQKKRFKKLEQSKVTAWKVTEEDWKQHKQYDAHLEAIEEMLAQTDTDFAPWTIIESHDRRFATVKVFTTVIDRLEQQLEAVKRANEQKEQRQAKQEKKSTQATETVAKTPSALNLSSSILDKVDLSCALSKEEYKAELKAYQQRIFEIEHEIYMKRIPVVILYQGWDAGGKGGNIRRLTQAMDPRGYEVIPIAAPNDIEKAHHYLWRFWQEFPKAGHIAIFDRSWYGRVLVERVEGFCSEQEWRRAYREINEMEEHMVNFGAVLVKFWLHIDQDEQLQRFKARQENPHKRRGLAQP
jgi:polyphosphate kinase 2 (PPK2 family)